MVFYEKDLYFFVVQVDHLSGECIGQVIGRFYQAGACNVQVVPSITKKNRPSYMVFIDCKPTEAEAVQELIVRELQAGGWHRIQTKHCYLHNEILEYPIHIENGKEKVSCMIKAKHFIGGTIRPEHDSIQELKGYISQEFGRELDHNTLYAYASVAIMEGEAVLDLAGSIPG